MLNRKALCLLLLHYAYQNSALKMIVLVFILAVNFQVGFTGSLADFAVDKHHERFPEDFCEKYDQYLTAWKSCFLLNGTNIQSRKYHEIICMDPSEEGLLWSLEVYAKQECKLPLRLYITPLRFNPDPNIFLSVAEHLTTLIIKSWDPVGNLNSHSEQKLDEEGRIYLKGHPFLHLKNLKLLDIEFAPAANLNSIPTSFFKGLDNLEALIIENLPHRSSIALGAFEPLVLHNHLKCLTILGSTIPCSCQAEGHPSNRAHWLHQWLHHHSHLWSSADFKRPVSYRDSDTGEGHFIQCKVRVDCEVTTEDPAKKLIINFHKYNFHQSCQQNTSTAAVTIATTTPSTITTDMEVMLDDDPPCVQLDISQNRAAIRKIRNNNSRLPDGQILCNDGYESDEPSLQHSRSSAAVRHGESLIFVATIFCLFG